MLFKYFDIDNRNGITKENVRAAMKRLGKEISDDELDKAFE